MSHREVMQQALEALELCRQADMRTSILLHTDDAIEALRAALAEPEPEPDCKPTVWVFECKASGFTDFHFTPNWYDSSEWNRTPLYATPLQRKPLTDEQMSTLLVQNGCLLHISVKDLVRAIERAHGIGSEA